MAGPWEKYAAASAPTGRKPWEKYAQAEAEEATAEALESAKPEMPPGFGELYRPGGERNVAGTDLEVREYPRITTFGPPGVSWSPTGPGATQELTRRAKLATGAALSGIPGPMAVELPLQFAGGALMASAEGEDPLVGGATDVAANLALRGAGKLVSKALNARAARRAAQVAEDAIEEPVADVARSTTATARPVDTETAQDLAQRALDGDDEAFEALMRLGEEQAPGTHAAGRPATRKRLVQALIESGYDEGNLTGKSATQLKQMLRERGIDPKIAGRGVQSTQDVVEAGEVAAEADQVGDEFVDRSLIKMHDNVADLEAIVEAEQAAKRGPNPASGTPARGGPSRAVQSAIDRSEARASGKLANEVDDTLFDERFEREATRDLPTEGLEEAPVRTEVAPGEIVEARPRDAWHPQYGQVRVDVVKGERVLGTDLRGRPRVMAKSDLKFIEPEELGRRAQDVVGEAARDPDLEDVLYEMGVEPGEKPVRAAAPQTPQQAGMSMGQGQATAGKGTAQHRSFKRRPEGTAGSTEAPEQVRLDSKSGFSKQLKEKVRKAVSGQRLGRVEANERNIRLHAKQARIMGAWQDAVKAGEVTAEQAQVRMMQELHGLEAGIEEVPGAGFTPKELSALQRYVAETIPNRFRWQHTAWALEGLQGGRQLRPAELRDLREALGPAFVPSGARDWKLWEWMKRLPLIASGTMKSLRASFDISAPLRQAKQLTLGHPTHAARAFWSQLQAFVSEGKYKTLLQAIEDNPLRDLQRASGLQLTELSDPVAASMGGREAEEMFAHSAAQLIPGVGQVVRGSERAYVTYLNKMRSDIFNKMAYSYMKNGITPETDPRVFKKLATAINLMSGRGKLGKVGEKAMPLLQTAFFAPRFMASRFMLLRDLPRLYMNYPAPVRKLLLKNVAVDIAATTAALYGLKELTGADLETDPRSSDFMKLRMGEIRLDPWAGFQPWVRLFYQLGSGEKKSPVSGRVSELSLRDEEGKRTPFGSTRLDALYRFLEQKAAPVPAIALDELRGESAVGEEMEYFQKQFPYIGKDTLQQFVPFIIQDIQEVMETGHDELLMLTIPFAALGGGVQAFPAPETQQKTGGPY